MSERKQPKAFIYRCSATTVAGEKISLFVYECSETAEVVPLADRLLNRYGEGTLQSISFDKGFAGYKRYVGLGVLAYNLHKIGARILRNPATADPPQRRKAA